MPPYFPVVPAIKKALGSAAPKSPMKRSLIPPTPPAKPSNPVTAKRGTRNAFTVATEKVSLGTTPFPGQTYTLPSENDDINEFVLTSTIAVTYATAPATTDVLPGNYGAYSNIWITSQDGKQIVNISGSDVLNIYPDLSQYNLAASANTGIGTGSATTITYTGTIDIPGLSLPRTGKAGSYKSQFQYSTLSAFNSTAGKVATAVSVTTTIQVLFGDTISGKTAYLQTQQLSLVSGQNVLAPVAAVQGPEIQEIILSGFAADSYLNYIQIQNADGSTVEPQLTEAMLAQRDKQEIQAARPTGTFWLREPSSITISPSSVFTIWTNNTVSALRIVYYWLV